jgi:hypothetical protein
LLRISRTLCAPSPNPLPALVVTCLSVLSCVHIDGVRVLSKAPNVECYTPEHQAFTVAAVVILVFVTVVVPVLVLMVNYVSVVGETQQSAVSKVLHKALGSIGRSIQQLSNGSLMEGQEEAVAKAEAALAQTKAAAAAVDVAECAGVPASEDTAATAAADPAGPATGMQEDTGSGTQAAASEPHLAVPGIVARDVDEPEVVGEEVEVTEIQRLASFGDALFGSDTTRTMTLTMSFRTMKSGAGKSSSAEVGTGEGQSPQGRVVRVWG